MFTKRKSRILLAGIALITLGALSGQQAFADQDPSQGMVLVNIDGQLLRQIPEAGSVRIVIDNQGRRLVLNNWDEVIGFEIPIWQYQQQNAAHRNDIRRNLNRSQVRDIELAPFPQPPAPTREQIATAEPDPDPDYVLDPNYSIESRDINPVTGTVQSQSSIIELPRKNTSHKNRLPDILPEKRTSVDKQPIIISPVSKPAPTLNQVQKATTQKLFSQAQVTNLQVYLDRNGISPGVIDGRMGSNVQKALDAWYEETGERLDPANTELIVNRLANEGGLAFMPYTITPEDAAGPYVASIPTDYADKAKMQRLAFTSTAEMLAERFHMDEDYLKALNPGVDFTRPGVQIKVVNIAGKTLHPVTNIIADKTLKQVRGYDASGKLVVAYPATIGSSDTPSPSGDVTIERIALNPDYTYNPKINFTQGSNTQILHIPPGPNGPVGSVWIALSKPTYGIHGTPEPSLIGKTASHGCVRLTNWDAQELASLVKPGVSVHFTD